MALAGPENSFQTKIYFCLWLLLIDTSDEPRLMKCHSVKVMLSLTLANVIALL